MEKWSVYMFTFKVSVDNNVHIHAEMSKTLSQPERNRKYLGFAFKVKAWKQQQQQ